MLEIQTQLPMLAQQHYTLSHSPIPQRIFGDLLTIKSQGWVTTMHFPPWQTQQESLPSYLWRAPPHTHTPCASVLSLPSQLSLPALGLPLVCEHWGSTHPL